MAALPHFYHKGVLVAGEEIGLEEETAKHIIQVLRMQTGDRVQLTNGAGFAAIATIAKAEKKRGSVVIEQVTFFEERKPGLYIGVAFTKNASRNEWLLEKVTELGAKGIIPLMTARTERDKIRYDRWHNILVAAMIQSQQYYLPVLETAMSLEKVLEKYGSLPQKLIGHCEKDIARQSVSKMLKSGLDTLALVGPEGDFTVDEINLCMGHQFIGVSMGTQRLRTETAAMSVSAYFNLVNHEEG